MEMMVSRKRVRVGDVLEVTMPKGLAYFQYTHQHPTHGGLIRVLNGLFDERPSNIRALVNDQERFVIFFPVRAAASRGLISIVAHEDIPLRAQAFPLFKAGDPGNWWLWDGQREWRVGKLTSDQRKLPVRETWNLTMLVTRIAQGWAPEAADVERG